MIQKIDFAKYCIIYTYGGVYVDMDSECLKSIDGLFTGKKIYFVDLDTDIFEKLLQTITVTFTTMGGLHR